MVPAIPWSFDEWFSERMIVYRCARRANFGSSSQISMPGTDVAAGRYGPRYSIGAAGFMSNVSRWLGPPQSQSRITDFAFAPSTAAWPSSLSRSPSDIPRAPRAPALISSRRVQPLQVRTLSRPISSIARLSHDRGRVLPAASSNYHFLVKLLQPSWAILPERSMKQKLLRGLVLSTNGASLLIHR